MNTTELYIELVIIGLETSVWMCIFFINIIGNTFIDFILKVFNNFSSSLLFIGIIYIIGLLMDRLSDMFFQGVEDKISKCSGLETDKSTLAWERFNKEYFFKYVRSRMRILRNSVINIPLITIALLWFVVISCPSIKIVLYLSVLGIVFTYVSWKSLVKSTKTYYNKAKLLQMIEKNTESNLEQ